MVVLWFYPDLPVNVEKHPKMEVQPRLTVKYW
jgi:hypothetical protein